MSLVQGLHHVAIQARDVEGVSRFFRDVLGLPELRRWLHDDPNQGLRSIWLACGDGFLAIERAGDGALPSDREFRSTLPGLHVVALRIRKEDRSAIGAKLAAAGVAIEHQTRWSLFIRDPEGNRIGLTHYPDEHAEV